MKFLYSIKNLYLHIVICFLFILPTACQKAPINGDLDGQWQVMEVYPTPDATIIPTRIYYCFSLHTCQLSYYGNGVWTSGNMTYDTSTLTLEFPYLDPSSEEVNSKLRQYGIYSNPVTFTIEHLDKNKLILRDGEVTISLRKF